MSCPHSLPLRSSCTTMNLLLVLNCSGMCNICLASSKLRMGVDAMDFSYNGLEHSLKNFPIENKNRIKWLVNILNSIHDSVLVVDINSTILFANPSYTRSLGVPVHKVLGKKLSKIEPESQVLDVLRTGEPIVDKRQRIYSLGVDIVANITPILEGNSIIGAVAIFRDISEVLELQEKLRETENEMVQAKNLSNKYFSELKELKNKFLDISDFVFQSSKIKQIVELAKRLSEVDSTVLLTGETGVGKEVIAKIIHRASKRSEGSFVVVNCGAIPENLLESELFGYDKGAFTGANKEGKVGLIEVAHNGTLLLDEVGDLPLASQVKILRVMQENKIMRVGGIKPIEVNVRFIAATNKNLGEMVKQKTFREDLFYRLNVVPINMPPLRERKEDIFPLIRYFLHKYNSQYNLNKSFSQELIYNLECCSWPGNVRELDNLIERLVVCSNDDNIGMGEETLTDYFGSKVPDGGQVIVTDLMELNKAKGLLEEQLIKKALSIYGSSRKAATALGVNHSTIIRKAQKYKLKSVYHPYFS